MPVHKKYPPGIHPQIPGIPRFITGFPVVQKGPVRAWVLHAPEAKMTLVYTNSFNSFYVAKVMMTPARDPKQGSYTNLYRKMAPCQNWRSNFSIKTRPCTGRGQNWCLGRSWAHQKLKKTLIDLTSKSKVSMGPSPRSI